MILAKDTKQKNDGQKVDLAKQIYSASESKDSDKLKSIFEHTENKDDLVHAVQVAHNLLARHNHFDAIERLLTFQDKYLNNQMHSYSDPGIEKSVNESIKKISRYAEEAETIISQKEPVKGHLQLIYDETLSLAKSVTTSGARLSVIKSDMSAAIHFLSEALFKHHYEIKSKIDSAIKDVTDKLGIVCDSISHGQANTNLKTISGVNINIEIQKIIQAIDEECYKSDERKKRQLSKEQKNRIAKLINSSARHLKKVRNLETRYLYLSRARSSIERHIQGLPKKLYNDIHGYVHELKDEEANMYKRNKRQAKLAARHQDRKSQPGLIITKEQADSLVEQAKEQMIKQSEPSRYQSWAKLACSISLLTGRRIYEICVIGDFKVIDSNTMQMTGIAKQHDENTRNKKTQEFYVFSDAHKILNSIKTLRNIRDFEIFKDQDYAKFSKSCNTPLRYALKPAKATAKPLFKNSDFIKIKLLPKTLRQIYAAILRFNLKVQNPGLVEQEIDSLVAENLGYHDGAFSTDYYKQIIVTDRYFSDEYPLDADTNNGLNEMQNRINI